MCWKCVLADTTKRYLRFSSTPPPLVRSLPLKARVFIEFARRSLPLLGLRHDIPTDQVKLFRFNERASTGISDGVDVREVLDIPSCEDGVLNYARVYWPVSEPRDKPLPGLVYVHGGGWMVGAPRSVQDTICRNLCKLACVAIVSISYRLAPEVRYAEGKTFGRRADCLCDGRFPVPVEDCFCAYKFITEHAVDFGMDQEKICVGGDRFGASFLDCP